MNFGKVVFLLCGTLLVEHVYSNTMTDFCGTYTAADFVSDLVMDHNEFVISNAQFTGDCGAGGKIDFSGATHYVEQEICGSSLVLSSGSLTTALVTSNSAESVSTNNGRPGDADLDAITAAVDTTYDAAVIDFDVTSTATTDVRVTFKYVFASEEYNEYAPSIFNDVFAFFVDGVNVAQVLVDGTDDQYVDVSINNINLNTNNGYYIDNDLNSGAFYNTEYDGLTHLLETIPFVLSPGITVHVKLAIADRTDYVWDSTVYLQAASFVEFSECSYDFQQCNSSPCDCNEINNCQNCNNGQCNQCSQGYFRLSYDHQCLDCGTLFPGCLHCQDFQGCAQCGNGYERVYNDDCGVYECVPENNECPRYRRPWHLLTTSEKQLYIDGFLYLHNNGLIPNQLATIHTNAWSQAHGGSGFLPWHRYFLYELETQIRHIGGQYACFGMPYWDWGHDSLAAFTSDVFTSGLSDGGPGCVNNDYFDFPNYYTTNNAQCLTRFSSTAALTFTPSATLVQQMLNNPAFGTFSGFRSVFESYHNTPHVIIGGNMGGGGSPYDPIFYLHHCYVDFLWAVWQDCHDYDLVDKNDLDCKVNIYDEYDNNGVSVDVGLDDELDFNDLHNQAWSVINDYNPTHRDMHDITEWNIIYDKGDFWDEGLVEHPSNCGNRMNNNGQNDWFVGSVRRRNMQDEASCSLNLQECDDNPLTNVCDCDELVPNTCNICHDGQGCAQCTDGYFKKSFNHKCLNCETFFDGKCQHCQDNNGCGQCNAPYIRVYDPDCEIYVCEDPYDPNATPAPTITNVVDVIADDWENILTTQTGLTMPEKRELLKTAVCQINKEYNIGHGNIPDCSVPDDFEDCSDMVIPAGQTDIDITLAELLNKPGVVDTPCLQDIRIAMYPWVSTTGGLLDLCNGFYDPQC